MVQVVNMLVTPAQAEQLSLAASQTSIQLVLRNPLDHEIAKTPGTALQRLFTGAQTHRVRLEVSARARGQRVPAAAPPPVRVVARRRRPKRSPSSWRSSRARTSGNRNSARTPEVK